MDDLASLQSRVEAARERLGGVEADQRKYGLRLDDLVRIVEGALSRQSEDLKAARIRSASLETELDDARNAISRSEVELASKETDIARLESQNEQLRTMVMTLLELVEGRNTTPLREAMVRLERGVRHLLSETSAKPVIEAPVSTPWPVNPRHRSHRLQRRVRSWCSHKPYRHKPYRAASRRRAQSPPSRNVSARRKSPTRMRWSS